MTYIPCPPGFDLAATLDCGQCFRWEQREGLWQGVAFGRELALRQVGDRLELRCDAAFIAQMLDKPEILEIVSRKAGAMLSRPIRAVVVDLQSQPKDAPRMEQLLNFGRSHGDIVTIKE